MNKKYYLVAQLSVFSLFLSIILPKSHALVVAPIIAVSILKVLIWLIGIISVPIGYIVKSITKAKFVTVLIITAVILTLIAGTVFVIHKIKISEVTKDSTVYVNKKLQGKPVSSNMYINTEDTNQGITFEENQKMVQDTQNQDREPLMYPSDKKYPTKPNFAPIPPKNFIVQSLIEKNLDKLVLMFIPIFVLFELINYYKKLWSFTTTLVLSICTTIVLFSINITLLLLLGFRITA